MPPTVKSSLELETSIQYLKGIGPKRGELLNKVNVQTIGDLLAYFPRRYLDRSRITPIRSLKAGDDATVVGKVYSCETIRGRKSRFVVLVGDKTGFLHCVWFRGLQYVSGAFQTGETVAFSGKVTLYRGPQLVHPEYDKISEDGENDPLHTGRIIPMYPSTEFLGSCGLDSRGFRRIVREALNRFKDKIPETLSDKICRQHHFVPLTEAYHDIHFPKDQHALARALERLKFEELFFLQLYLAMQRKEREGEQVGISFARAGELIKKLIDHLPFELTDAQKKCIRSIRQDMKCKRAMNRLLQGDVGSGKTVVALVAMLIAVENGYQSALMAPTEILAEQHYLTIRQLLGDLNINLVLLRGGQKNAERQNALESLACGKVDIAVGTHALVQEAVDFKNLGFVVIDEQHRFGVLQRARLRRKGIQPDVLVMTATPIPRTLALTLYGDLDISVLDSMPEGRLPVRTVWRKAGKRKEIYEFIREEASKNRQAYIVYPLVEESEKIDLAAAKEGWQVLSSDVFPEYYVGLLHGRMKTDEKEEVMRLFKSGEIDILVATTVVEVGVDNPNATVMLVEHAERFGLTQLHQLRGRIGRGKEPSTCILLSHGRYTDDAGRRLETMVETHDGFRIAEVDLDIRGPGELFGTKQHGLLDFRLVDLMKDASLLEKAREESCRLMEEDADLVSEENKPIHEAYGRKYQDRYRLIKVG